MYTDFSPFEVLPEFREKFIPKDPHTLSSFESWAMVKAYAALFKEVYGEDRCPPLSKIEDNCVWDGVYLYNVEYQIVLEELLIDLDDPNLLDKNPFSSARSRLWLTKKGVLMLEVYSDNHPSRLYRCGW